MDESGGGEPTEACAIGRLDVIPRGVALAEAKEAIAMRVKGRGRAARNARRQPRPSRPGLASVFAELTQRGAVSLREERLGKRICGGGIAPVALAEGPPEGIRARKQQRVHLGALRRPAVLHQVLNVLLDALLVLVLVDGIVLSDVGLVVLGRGLTLAG